MRAGYRMGHRAVDGAGARVGSLATAVWRLCRFIIWLEEVEEVEEIPHDPVWKVTAVVHDKRALRRREPSLKTAPVSQAKTSSRVGVPGGSFGELLHIEDYAGHDRGQACITRRSRDRTADQRLVPAGPHHAPIDSVREPCIESRCRAV